MPPHQGPDGALLIDKPSGITSHDVVDVVRRHLGTKKVGHCGTLDPNATGLLVIVIGRATKLSEKLMGQDKVYEGEIKFGETTDSYDCKGQIQQTSEVPPLTVDQLNEATVPFVGDLMQVPPMVSAIKKDGVPLYKLARKGIEVERPPKLIHIYRWKFTAYRDPLAEFNIACTKGTYVRSLAHDLGQAIGCGAHLHSLRRLSSGTLNVDQAIPLESLRSTPKPEIHRLLIPVSNLAAR